MVRYFETAQLLMACALTLVVAVGAHAKRPKSKKTMIQGHMMYTLLRPGDIPAIFEPQFIPVAKAADLYHRDEPLIAVADGDAAKAYSIWHLDQHEVVNDYINGNAITTTW